MSPEPPASVSPEPSVNRLFRTKRQAYSVVVPPLEVLKKTRASFVASNVFEPVSEQAAGRCLRFFAIADGGAAASPASASTATAMRRL